jgi:hypothetical protein
MATGGGKTHHPRTRCGWSSAHAMCTHVARRCDTAAAASASSPRRQKVSRFCSAHCAPVGDGGTGTWCPPFGEAHASSARARLQRGGKRVACGWTTEPTSTLGVWFLTIAIAYGAASVATSLDGRLLCGSAAGRLRQHANLPQDVCYSVTGLRAHGDPVPTPPRPTGPLSRRPV